MQTTRLTPSRRTLLRVLAAGSAALLITHRPGHRAGSVVVGLAHDAGDRPVRGSSRDGERIAAHMEEDDDDAIPLLIPDDVREDEAWVDVNLSEQAAVAMLGREWMRVALATTGKLGWETPEGQFRIVRRVPNETMTSAALGIDDPDDQYVLTDVLYTQYFTWQGHALHLNYWRPDYVFGSEATSHGCVGLRLNDARFFWDHLRTGSRVVVHA